MKPKQILILFVILGALSAGLILKAWVRSSAEKEALISGQGVVLSDLDPAQIERVLIHRTVSEAAPVELLKEQGVWKIQSLWNVSADPVKVKELLQRLSMLRGELRGRGEALLKDFGIGDEDAFSVRCVGAGDAMLLDFRMGNKQPGAAGLFLRKSGSADVYQVDLEPEELLGSYIDLETESPTSQAWADLRLFELDPEKVTKIEAVRIQGEKEAVVTGLALEADPNDPVASAWKFMRHEMNLELDPEKVIRFIVTMNSVRAEKALDPGAKDYGLEKPVWQLIVTEDGQKKILSAGPKDEGGDRYPVKTSTGPSIFSLSGSYFEDLNVDDTHFVKEVSASEASEALPEEETT